MSSQARPCRSVERRIRAPAGVRAPFHADRRLQAVWRGEGIGLGTETDATCKLLPGRAQEKRTRILQWSDGADEVGAWPCGLVPVKVVVAPQSVRVSSFMKDAQSRRELSERTADIVASVAMGAADRGCGNQSSGRPIAAKLQDVRGNERAFVGAPKTGAADEDSQGHAVPSSRLPASEDAEGAGFQSDAQWLPKPDLNPHVGSPQRSLVEDRSPTTRVLAPLYNSRLLGSFRGGRSRLGRFTSAGGLPRRTEQAALRSLLVVAAAGLEVSPRALQRLVYRDMDGTSVGARDGNIDLAAELIAGCTAASSRAEQGPVAPGAPSVSPRYGDASGGHGSLSLEVPPFDDWQQEARSSSRISVRPGI
jgi:hypothetical protein